MTTSDVSTHYFTPITQAFFPPHRARVLEKLQPPLRLPHSTLYKTLTDEGILTLHSSIKAYETHGDDHSNATPKLL